MVRLGTRLGLDKEGLAFTRRHDMHRFRDVVGHPDTLRFLREQLGSGITIQNRPTTTQTASGTVDSFSLLHEHATAPVAMDHHRPVCLPGQREHDSGSFFLELEHILFRVACRCLDAQFSMFNLFQRLRFLQLGIILQALTL